MQEAWAKQSGLIHISTQEKTIPGMTFLPVEIIANIKYHAQHNPVGEYSPNDPGYTNIYAQPGFSYQCLAEQYLKYLDNTRSNLSSEDYLSRRDTIEEFLPALSRYGVN